MRRLFLVVVILGLVIGISPSIVQVTLVQNTLAQNTLVQNALAQDTAQSDEASLDEAPLDEAPLLRMMARIPDTRPVYDRLSYVDYAALFAAYPDAPDVHSYADFERYTADHSNPDRLTVLGMMESIFSGPYLLQSAYLRAEQIPVTMGFDLFDIKRAVAFGAPADTVFLLEGDFDPDAVIAAHEARGYTVTDLDGMTLLCGADGCDGGNQPDPLKVDRANLFNGDIGFSLPVLLGDGANDGMMASSSTMDGMTMVADTFSGTGDSIAEQPDYRAAAEALSANASLTQATFITAAQIQRGAYMLLPIRSLPTDRETLIAQLEADFVPIPQYTVIGIGDTMTESEEKVVIALVYVNAASAQSAADMFPDHLTDSTSIFQNRTMGDILDDLDVTSVETTVYTPSVNRTVMVLTISAPLLPERANALPVSQKIGLVYKMMADMFLQNDVAWVATYF